MCSCFYTERFLQITKFGSHWSSENHEVKVKSVKVIEATQSVQSTFTRVNQAFRTLEERRGTERGAVRGAERRSEGKRIFY